jgi:hypothetical protein
MPEVGTRVEGHPVNILIQFLFHVGGTPARTVGILPIGHNVSHADHRRLRNASGATVPGLPKHKRPTPFDYDDNVLRPARTTPRLAAVRARGRRRTTIIGRTVRWGQTAIKPPPHTVDLTAAWANGVRAWVI